MKRYIVLLSHEHRDGTRTDSWKSLPSAEAARQFVRDRQNDSDQSSTKLIEYEIIKVASISLEGGNQ